MRSIALVLTGIAAGLATGIFGAGYFQNHKQSINNPPAAVVQTGRTQTAAQDNPFAAVTEPETTKNTQTTNDTAISATQIKQTELPPGVPETDVSGINHYRDLHAWFQHLESLNSQQLEALLDQIQPEHRPVSFSNTLGTAIYQRWAELDTDSALEHAIAGLEQRNHGEIPTRVISWLATQYPDIVSSRAAELADGNPNSHLQYLVNEGIAAKDPEQFLRDLTDTQTGNPGQADMAMMALMNWAEKDPAAAWDFASNEYTDHLENYLHEQILHMWFMRDPDAALPEIEAALSNSNSRPEEKMMLTDLYATHLAQDNPEAALHWAVSLPDSLLREQALMNVLYNYEGGSAESMISFIDQLSAEDKNRILPMATAAIASNLAGTDPVAALQWAEQLPPGSRFEAQQVTIGQWASTDPAAATSWALALPQTPQNQQLILAAAHSAIYTDPDAGKLLFEQLPADMQTGMIEPMLSTLSRLGPEAAEQWLSEQSNPAVQQKGAILIDMRNPDSDTYSTLDKIAALQPRDRNDLMIRYLEERAYMDRDTVNQWITETGTLTQQERDLYKQITGSGGYGFGSPYGGGAAAYTRRFDLQNGLISIEPATEESTE